MKNWNSPNALMLRIQHMSEAVENKSISMVEAGVQRDLLHEAVALYNGTVREMAVSIAAKAIGARINTQRAFEEPTGPRLIDAAAE